jgi:outer membrane protein assembly factor BamB
MYFSPRGVDLDGNGTLEIIVSGGLESPPSGEVLALEGDSGKLLWSVPADQQLYGSPVFVDVTNDGVKDVFAGGRNEQFLAIDGASGELLWKFADDGSSTPHGWYNFYSAVVVGDLSGDGLADLLLSNGGADGIEPFAPRPTGNLLLVNSKDGTVLASASNPDEEETYMSPLVVPDPGGASPTVLFGTGGETRAGGLWRTTLSAVQSADISSATQLTAGERKGVIAPPALGDLNADGSVDAIVATFDGRLIALDLTDNATLWERSFEGTESYNTPILGHFNEDDTPDAFVVFLEGEFPVYERALYAVVDGRNGKLLWDGEAGNFAMAGDIAVDLDRDGRDEVIFVSNDKTAGEGAQQQLHLLDPANGREIKWGEPLGGTLASSPWVGDVDRDGCLDMLLSRFEREGGMGRGLITRLRIAARAPERISWSGYLGSDFDSTLAP